MVSEAVDHDRGAAPSRARDLALVIPQYHDGWRAAAGAMDAGVSLLRACATVIARLALPNCDIGISFVAMLRRRRDEVQEVLEGPIDVDSAGGRSAGTLTYRSTSR
jgi:hypothetical protein